MKERLTRIYTCDIFLTSDRAMNQERNNNRDFNTCRTRTIIWFHTPVLHGPSFYRKDTETRMSQVGAVVQSEMELGVTDTFISLMVMMVSKCTPMSQPVCVLSCSVVTDSLQSMNCSPSGSSVHGILQARILEWVAVSSSGDLPNPGIKSVSFASPALAGRFFTTASPGKPYVTTYQMHTLKVCSLLSDKCASIKFSF